MNIYFLAYLPFFLKNYASAYIRDMLTLAAPTLGVNNLPSVSMQPANPSISWLQSDVLYGCRLRHGAILC